MLARATERKRRYWDQAFGIRNKKKKDCSDGDTESKPLGG